MDFDNYDIADYPYHHGNILTPSHPSSSSQQHLRSSDFISSYKCVLLNYPINSTSSTYFNYYTLWLLNLNPLYPPGNLYTPLHHVIYQTSQILLLSFLFLFGSGARNPHGNTRKSQLFWALSVLLGYVILQATWGILILKSIDIGFWNSLVGIVIIFKIIQLLCCCCKPSSSSLPSTPSGRKIKSNSSYSNGTFAIHTNNKQNNNDSSSLEIDTIYSRLFAPVRVPYRQFTKVISCKRGFRVLATGENYAVEKRSRVDTLGLLVSGRLVVSQGGKALHVILPYQFVDSPEFFGVATDELFQVTITALEDSKLLVWHRDKLRLTIMNDEFLRVIFDHIIGRDVVFKLIQVSDTVMTTPTIITTSPLSPAAITTTTTSLSSASSPSSSQQPPSITQPHQLISPQQQPISLISSRKEKYTYHPTFLTSLSEEKISNGNCAPPPPSTNGGVVIATNSFDDEEEEEEEEEEIESVCISGNEKEPMLINGSNGGNSGGGESNGGVSVVVVGE